MSAITLRNSAALVAAGAMRFGALTICATVAEKTCSGPILSEIRSVLSEASVIDPPTLNCWEDRNIADAFGRIGISRIVLAAVPAGRA